MSRQPSRTTIPQTQTRISPTSSTEVDIHYVPPERIDEFWPDVESYIERAMDYSGGAFTAEDIKEQLVEGDMLLWLFGVDGELIASAVTQISYYPKKSALIVVCVGGKDFWTWVGPFIDALEQYRQELGVDCIRAHCRDGMAHWLNKLGWHRVMTLMEK